MHDNSFLWFYYIYLGLQVLHATPMIFSIQFLASFFGADVFAPKSDHYRKHEHVIRTWLCYVCF